MSANIPKIGFVSLGCPKALVDSERILTRLRSEGYGTSPSYEEADLVVVNTCGFIDAAIEESLDAIGEALGANGRVVVTGCLGARAERLRELFPQVLEITGPRACEQVVAAVHRHLPAPHDPFARLVPPQGVKLTPRHYAYLKISEGCNHRCSFCIIPQLRGKLVSRPIEEILQEAERLVQAGVRELLVIAQDTSAYGVDQRHRGGAWRGRVLPGRIEALAGALGELGVWVRMHYLYPYPHVDALLPLMAEGKILPYLDVPMQHSSPAILRAMRRPAASACMLQRIERWRAICPDLTLRSTFIVGFPGESEEDFGQLLAFLEEARLDRVGCFTYSAVEGAAANALANPVPESVKEERQERLMALQSEISRRKLEQKVGSTMKVLVDAGGPEGIVARGPGDAPEIDGRVLIEGCVLRPGDFAEVRVTAASEHDLWAEPSS